MTDKLADLMKFDFGAKKSQQSALAIYVIEAFI